MITVDKQSRVPVYEQIKNQLLTLIRLGVFPVNTQVPSIRSVSSETGVNVNTVKKAYAELELSGVIYTVPGTGSFVSENAIGNSAVISKAMQNTSGCIEIARSIGVSKEDMIALVNKIYGEEEK